MARDYYDVLGVGRGADAIAIKRAYRARARELHPDRSADPSAPAHLQEVFEAYAVLSDDESRRLYDRLGWRGRGRAWTPRRGMARVYTSNPRAFLDDLESILATAVGRRPVRDRARVVGEVHVDAYEAAIGATRSVAVVEPRPCPACGGQGKRTVVSHKDAGRFVSLERCTECNGKGEDDGVREVQVIVPPRTWDRDEIPVGAGGVAVVRIVQPRDNLVVRLVAVVALLVAVGFLLFLLAL